MEETVGLKDFEGFRNAIVNADNYIDGLGIGRLRLCKGILEINESTLRSLLKSKMRYEISKDTLISCYKLYMLQPENKREDYRNFFEGNIEVYIKDINIEECRNKLDEMIPLHMKKEAEELEQILPMDEDKLEKPDPVITDDEKESKELEQVLLEGEDKTEEPDPVITNDEREMKGLEQILPMAEDKLEEPDSVITDDEKESEELEQVLLGNEDKTEEPDPIAIVDERESEEQELILETEEKGSDAQEIQMVDLPDNMEEVPTREISEPVEKAKEQRKVPMLICQFMDFLNDCLGVHYEFEFLDWFEERYFTIRYREKIGGNAEGKEWNVMAVFDMRVFDSEIDEIFLKLIDKVSMLWFIINTKKDIGELQYVLWREKFPQFYEKVVFETNGDKIYISQNTSGIRWKQLINGHYLVKKK